MGISIRRPETDGEWETYYDMRYRILREPLGKERGSERNEGDAAGLHFALYENDILKAIARLDNAGESSAQVRFVAVETELQGQGYGRQIMEATEVAAKNDGSHTMILHARDYAVAFYLRLGYHTVEPSYKLFDVLQHYLMEKDL